MNPRNLTPLATPRLDLLAPVWTPHPGQLAFLTARAKHRVLVSGRKWGKTDDCTADVVLDLAVIIGVGWGCRAELLEIVPLPQTDRTEQRRTLATLGRR